MDPPQLVRQLVESFNALADEVQNLTDRKTILEHKLRYAHEQVCRLPFASFYHIHAGRHAHQAHDIMMNNLSSRSA